MEQGQMAFFLPSPPLFAFAHRLLEAVLSFHFFFKKKIAFLTLSTAALKTELYLRTDEQRNPPPQTIFD